MEATDWLVFTMLWAYATQISMIVSMFLSFSPFALDIFVTGKRVNHVVEYGLKIPVNSRFYGRKEPIKLAKNKITYIEEYLNKTLSKVKRIQVVMHI